MACEIGKARVADPGVEPLDAAGSNVGVDAVVDPCDAVVGQGGIGGDGVVEVGVDEAAAPNAVIAGESGEPAERVLLPTGSGPEAGEVGSGGYGAFEAPPCASLGAAARAVVGEGAAGVNQSLARFAQGGGAGDRLEGQVVAVHVEGLVDPAGGDVGRPHPLALSFGAGRGDDGGLGAEPVRCALADGRFERGEAEADGFVLCLGGTEGSLLPDAAFEVGELVDRSVREVVHPNLPERGLTAQ